MSIMAMSHGIAQDMQRLCEMDINGTARYVGMAGSMTAVGGDPSAAHDNPAGLGVYRRFESMITFGEMLDYTHQCIGRDKSVNSLYSSFHVPQVSFVFSFGNDAITRGLSYSNWMISYHRLKNFHRSSSAVLSGQTGSVTDAMAEQAQGNPYAAFATSDVWDNINIGWLSVLGYDTYLINPLTSDSSHWVSCLTGNERVRSSLNIDESGYVDCFTLSWGGNFSNQFYFGVGLNIRSLSYSKSTRYTEVDEQRCNWMVETGQTQSGIGVNGVVGLIYKPIHILRIGAAFQTPSAVGLTTRSWGKSVSFGLMTDENGRALTIESETPICTVSSHLQMPLRVSAGLAVLLGDKGLVSAEYNYSWMKELEGVHTWRVGTELVVKRNWFFNLGYALSTSFRAEDKVRQPAYNSYFCDTDYYNMGIQHYGGAAIGYRNQHAVVQLGYQYRWQSNRLYAHCYQTEPFFMESATHRIVLTVGWHNSR